MLIFFIFCSDMEIRLVDLTTMDCKVFAGHKAPVLSVCVDPKLEYIVSYSGIIPHLIAFDNNNLPNFEMSINY